LRFGSERLENRLYFEPQDYRTCLGLPTYPASPPVSDEIGVILGGWGDSELLNVVEFQKWN